MQTVAAPGDGHYFLVRDNEMIEVTVFRGYAHNF
jgi:hypothetical protein